MIEAKRRKKGWMNLRIKDVKIENSTTKTLIFEDPPCVPKAAFTLSSNA